MEVRLVSRLKTLRSATRAAARCTRIRVIAAAGVLLVAGGCAGTADREAIADWRAVEADLYAPHGLDRAVGSGGAVELPAPMDLAAEQTLDDYIRYAMRHNPGLAAAFAQWRAAIEEIPQARALPDPRVSFAVVLDQVERDVGYMGERYSLSQMFPWFGTLRLRGDVAAAAALAAGRRFEAARLELADRVVGTYAETVYLSRAARIARENRDLLLALESVARARYRAGAVSQADVNRAQVELGRVDDRVRSLEDRFEASIAAFEAALGRPVARREAAAFDRPLEEVVAPLPERTDAQWLVLAREHNPELLALRHDAASRQAAVALARKGYRPGFELGVEYARNGSARMAMMDGGGADMIMAMIAIDLPLRRGRLEAGVSQAAALFGEATHRIEDRQTRLAAELQWALFEYRDSRRRLELFGGTLLPKARQALANTESAYRVGDVGFADLIDAQRVLLEFALEQERAAADRARGIARISMLVGTDANDQREASDPLDAGEFLE